MPKLVWRRGVGGLWYPSIWWGTNDPPSAGDKQVVHPIKDFILEENAPISQDVWDALRLRHPKPADDFEPPKKKKAALDATTSCDVQFDVLIAERGKMQ